MPLYDRRPARARPALASRIGPPPGARDRRDPQHVEPSRLPQVGTAASVLVAGGALALVTAQPAAATSRGDRVVALAAQEKGSPYQWGAEGPTSFDCSGLVQFVYKRMGIALPRTAALQDRWLTPVPRKQVRKGDVISFYDKTGHVFHNGIYAGRGRIWHAPETGKPVQLQRIWRDTFRVGRPGAGPAPAPARRAAPVVLKAGMAGSAVAVVQRRLRLTPDGEFGPATTRAVAAFQKRHRLLADGEVGPSTMRVLFPPPPRPVVPRRSPVLQPGSTGRYVLAVQHLLRVPGDSEYGPRTVAAVKRFQVSRGLPPDGEVGPRTWTALRKAYDRR